MKFTKSLFSLLIFGLSLMFFASCGCEHVWQPATCETPKTCSICLATEGNSLNHIWQDETCENPKYCLICGETTGQALGHTLEGWECTRCGEDFGAWKAGYFVDAFGRPFTDVKFMYTDAEGTFSNSVTTNSELSVRIEYFGGIDIKLWEYSSYPVTCSYGEDKYSILMLDTNGNTHLLTGTMENGSSEISVNKFDYKKIIEALEGDGEIEFVISPYDKPITRYYFTIETSNFKDLRSKLKLYS